MSPAYIVALVVGGVFALLLLGYASNQHEKHKLERARRRSELNERQMRLASLSDGLPGQYLHARLKQGCTNSNCNLFRKFSRMSLIIKKFDFVKKSCEAA